MLFLIIKLINSHTHIVLSYIQNVYRQQHCITKKEQCGTFFLLSGTFVPQQNDKPNESQIELNNRVARLLDSLSALNSYFYPPQQHIGDNNMRRTKYFDGLLQLADPNTSQFVHILKEMGPQLSLNRVFKSNLLMN